MSDGMILLTIGIVTLSLLTWRQAVIEWHRYKARQERLRIMASMTAGMRELERVFGEALVPALQDVGTAFTRFAVAWSVGEDESK